MWDPEDDSAFRVNLTGHPSERIQRIRGPIEMRRSYRCALVAAAAAVFCAFTAPGAVAQSTSAATKPVAGSGWSGFYVGVNVGYGRSSNQTFGQTDTLEYLQAFGPAFLKPISFQGRDSSALGGVQFGYNWQAATNWLVGIEADWSWARFRVEGATGPLVEFDNTIALDTSSKFTTDVRGLGSIRGRVGYTQQTWMMYFTGGIAIADMKFEADFICPTATCGNDRHAPASFSRTRLGWALGGGAEFRLPGSSWIFGLEYLRYSFNSTDTADAAIVNSPSGVPSLMGSCQAGQTCVHYSFGGIALDTVRARLTYKFD
jgi:outer membrane immunogenic protein